MAEHVTVSNVPDVCHTSILLHSMTWVVRTSEMFGSTQKKAGHCPHLGCWFRANRRFWTAASVQGVHFRRSGPDSVAQPLKSGGGKSLITMQTSKTCCLDKDGLPQTTRDTTELIKSRAHPFSSPDSQQENRFPPSCCPHGTQVGFSQDSEADSWLPRQGDGCTQTLTGAGGCVRSWWALVSIHSEPTTVFVTRTVLFPAPAV